MCTHTVMGVGGVGDGHVSRIHPVRKTARTFRHPYLIRTQNDSYIPGQKRTFGCFVMPYRSSHLPDRVVCVAKAPEAIPAWKNVVRSLSSQKARAAFIHETNSSRKKKKEKSGLVFLRVRLLCCRSSSTKHRYPTQSRGAPQQGCSA